MGSILSTLSRTRERFAISTLAIIGLIYYIYKKRKDFASWLLIKSLRFYMDSPKKKFKDTEHPTAPDYNNIDNWCAYPGKKSNAEMVPSGYKAVPENKRKVDIFWIHPTGLFHGPAWNQPVPDKQGDEQTDCWHMAGQASAFNETCRIYSPYYRQMHFAGYMLNKEDGRLALSLAYEDIKSSFEHFLKQIGPTKPFLLGSHSQGGHHMVRLLEDYIENKNMSKRMIACYVIGSKVPLDKFQRSYPSLHECTGPRDHTGCVIGWDTMSENASTLGPDLMPQMPGQWYKTGWETTVYTKAGKILNTNPLTWKRTNSGEGRIVGTKLWKGHLMMEFNIKHLITIQEFASGKPMGMVTERLYREDPVDPNEFWVESKYDRLAVPELPLNKLGPLQNLMTGGNYHCGDYSFFYFNIRENVKERVKAYFNNTQ